MKFAKFALIVCAALISFGVLSVLVCIGVFVVVIAWIVKFLTFDRFNGRGI